MRKTTASEALLSAIFSSSTTSRGNPRMDTLDTLLAYSQGDTRMDTLESLYNYSREEMNLCLMQQKQEGATAKPPASSDDDKGKQLQDKPSTTTDDSRDEMIQESVETSRQEGGGVLTRVEDNWQGGGGVLQGVAETLEGGVLTRVAGNLQGSGVLTRVTDNFACCTRNIRVSDYMDEAFLEDDFYELVYRPSRRPGALHNALASSPSYDEGLIKPVLSNITESDEKTVYTLETTRTKELSTKKNLSSLYMDYASWSRVFCSSDK